MWQVDNYTKLAAHGYFVRDRDGAEYWVINVVPQIARRTSQHRDPITYDCPNRAARQQAVVNDHV
jgi:hypothetical protein